MSESEPTLVECAEAVYNDIRAINHITITVRKGIPAPTVYSVLGNLKMATGSMLTQALNQLANGLERSIKNYDVYMDDGSDPALAAASAARHMRRAAELAEQLGQELIEAQADIAAQGYRG